MAAGTTTNNTAPTKATPARALRGRAPKETVPGKPKILVFGRAGIGKTWTALDFPSVYYIDTEAGADLPHYQSKLEASGAAYMGPKDGAQDFDRVLEEVVTLATIKHPYRTLVIDSFTKLFSARMAESEEELIRQGRKIEFSVEKKDPVKKTRRLIAWLDKLDMTVILICHEKEQWAVVNGLREAVGFTFDGWEKLDYELHLALRVVKEGNSRKAKVTKTRMLGFPENETFPWSYADFAMRFGRDIIESEAHAIEIASPKQVEDIKKLVDVLRVEEGVIATWLEKAGVDSWEEMPAELIQKSIDFLRARIPTA